MIKKIIGKICDIIQSSVGWVICVLIAFIWVKMGLIQPILEFFVYIGKLLNSINIKEEELIMAWILGFILWVLLVLAIKYKTS